MALFVHPSTEDITLAGILTALADPVRLRIIQTLLEQEGCTSCSQAAPCPKIAKSTLSHHFRILREAGLIRTTKQGVENRSVVRIDDVEGKFPGLLKAIFSCSGQKEN